MFRSSRSWRLLAAGTVIAQPNPQTLTGGVGVEERAQMMQRYDEYNLHLAFAQPDGQYLAGVNKTPDRITS